MTEIHPDRESYEYIWTEVINAEIENYERRYANCIKRIPDLKEEIWTQYVRLNSYCKTTYMKDSQGKLDRHKVSACYMIAILNVRPMRFVKKIDNKGVPLAINETLAITVGLSLLRAYAIAAIENTKDEILISTLIPKFQSGIKIPDNELINHGNYIENYARELYFAVTEGRVCVLSMAHELYLLEIFTRMS